MATPPGRGGVGIVRVSGPAAPALARAILGEAPPPRYALFRRFRGPCNETLDEGLAIFFRAPHSFTGEDVLELHGHGGPVLMERLVQRCVALGARRAGPGEFTARAFMHGRLDLAQAEAVADLIAAQSEAGARAALRSLEGVFSRRVGDLVEALIELRVYVESAIDFADEEIDFLGEGAVAARLEGISAALAATLEDAARGRALNEGMTVVIAGRPNAGKSSLLNALVGDDAAIVTDTPGTTRDVLRERLDLDGMPLQVLDTAGLRECSDSVEQAGVRRAWAAMDRADRLLLVVDDRHGIGVTERAVVAKRATPRTIIRSKIDLTGRTPGIGEGELGVECALSAYTGDGLATLREHLKATAGFAQESGAFSARQRHLDALREAASHVSCASHQLTANAAGELVAEDLRAAQDALATVTGTVTSDALLGRIFASFCIGK